MNRPADVLWRSALVALLLPLTVACGGDDGDADPLHAPGDTVVLSSEFGNGEVLISVGEGEQTDSSTVRTPPGTAAVLLEVQQGDLPADDKLVRYRVRTLVGRQTTGWVYRGDTRAR